MRTFYASGFLSVVKTAGVWTLKVNSDGVLPEPTRLGNLAAFKSYEDTFQELALAASRASLKRLITVLETSGCKYGDLHDICAEFNGRIVDETEARLFFAMTQRESELYSNPRNGWQASIERFPRIVEDVEEASKCFALSRYAASVFHSIQIVEAGLLELGTFLKVKDPKSGWTAVAGALAAVVRKEWKNKSHFEKRNHEFLEQVHGTVEGLKNAWRNKISHVDGRLILMSKDFNHEIAEEILFATRAFVRRLAEGLPPPKTKKTKKASSEPQAV